MMEAVLIAIPKEQAAFEAYSSLAVKAQDEPTRKMFEFLAAQEKGHEEKLRGVLSFLKTQLEYETLGDNQKK